MLISHLELQETAHEPPVATPVRKRTPELEQPTANDVAKVAKTTESQPVLPPTTDSTTRHGDAGESEQATPGDQQVDDKPALVGKQGFNDLTRRQAQRCDLLCVRKLYCIERYSCFLSWFQIA